MPDQLDNVVSKYMHLYWKVIAGVLATLIAGSTLITEAVAWQIQQDKDIVAQTTDIQSLKVLQTKQQVTQEAIHDIQLEQATINERTLNIEKMLMRIENKIGQ